MAGKERIGARNQYAAKLEGLCGKTELAVTALNHLPPHVVERIGEERKRSDVPDRIF